jgi:hypothetical protein
MTTAAEKTQHTPGLGWALVKPTLTSTEYMPVEIIRRGKRFTFVRTRSGIEWRYKTRGLWDGFASEEAAYDELQKLRASTAEYLRAKAVQP